MKITPIVFPDPALETESDCKAVPVPDRPGGAGLNFRLADNRSKTRLTAADPSRTLASRSHGGIRSKLRGTVAGPGANWRWRQAVAFYANNSWARINCCATLTPFGH